LGPKTKTKREERQKTGGKCLRVTGAGVEKKKTRAIARSLNNNKGKSKEPNVTTFMLMFNLWARVALL